QVLELDSWRDGQHFHQVFKRGDPQPHKIETCPPNKHGTRMRWKADLSLFDEGAHYDYDLLISRIKPAAYLNPGLRVILTLHQPGEEKPHVYEFHSEAGLAGYLVDMLREMEGEDARPLFNQPIMIQGERDGVSVQAAVLVSSESYQTTIHS